MLETSRRSVLKGLGFATLAGALPVAVAHAAQPLELPRLIAEYEAAVSAERKADAVATAAQHAFRDKVRAAKLRVRMTPLGGMPDYVALNHDNDPAYLRTRIVELYERRIEIATARADNPINYVLPSVEDIRKDYVSVAAAAEVVFAEWQALYEQCGVEPAQHAAGDAGLARIDACTALLTYKPKSLEEVRRIVAAFYREAQETGHWFAIPAAEIFRMINPELPEA